MDQLFTAVSTALLVELLVVIHVRSREARTIGEVLHSVHAGHRRRLASAFVLAAVAVFAFVDREALPLSWSLPIVLLTALVVAVVPARGDAVCGLTGVRRGWCVVPMTDFEEWRLVGQHLRFRVGGRWDAVPLPPESHPALAAELARRIPDRESPYR